MRKRKGNIVEFFKCLEGAKHSASNVLKSLINGRCVY